MCEMLGGQSVYVLLRSDLTLLSEMNVIAANLNTMIFKDSFLSFYLCFIYFPLILWPLFHCYVFIFKILWAERIS